MTPRTSAATAKRRESTSRCRRLLVDAADRLVAKGEFDPPVRRLLKESGVGKTFWYDHPEVRDEIATRLESARAQATQDAGRGAVASIESFKAENDNLQAIIARKDQVIGRLERRLAELLGQTVEGSWEPPELTEPDNGELEATLADAQHEIVRLREEVMALEDSLEAAREVNRRHVSLVATPEAS